MSFLSAAHCKLRPAQHAAAPGLRAEATLESFPAMAKTLHLLIVDDNEDLGAMLVEYLNEIGHQAVAATSAEQAIANLEAQAFDVLMTDVSLPGMSGIELAKTVASRFPRVGIAISSGYVDVLARDYFPPELESLVVLIAKPCELKELPGFLEEALARAQCARL